MKRKAFITNSDLETQKAGEIFAKELKPGDMVCLYGELGAGKTTFVKGIAAGLGIQSRIISPTFVLVRKHKISSKYQVLGIKYLYHIDLYRLEYESDVVGIDLRDLIEDKNSVILIEWPERAENFLQNPSWKISFDYIEGTKRKITLYGNTKRS